MAIPLAATLGITSGLSLLGSLLGGRGRQIPQELQNQFLTLYDRAMGGDGQARQSLMDMIEQLQRNRYVDMTGAADQAYSAPYPDGYWSSQFYTPEEQAGILDEEGLQNLLPTAEQLQAMGYTQDEIQEILGNPYAGFNYFGEQGGRAQDDLGVTEGRLFDTLAEQGRNIRQGTADAGRRGYQALDWARGDLRDIARNPNLLTREGYQDELNRIADDPNLGLSGEFQSGYEFGDKDREGLEYLANRSVGARYDRLLDDVRRQMTASGVTNPLALSGLMKEYNNQSAADAGDAAVGARLQGRREQLDRMRDKEGMRLDAAGRQASLRLNSRTAGERDRLAAQQFASNLQRGVEEGLLDRDLSLNELLARLNLQGEQYLGSSQLGTIRDAGDARQRLNQLIMTGGANLMQRGEEEGSRRRQTVANQRTDTARFVPQMMFGMGMNLSNTRSGRRAGIADTRLGFERERRGYYTGQAGAAQTGMNQSANNAAGFWGMRGDQAARGAAGASGNFQWNASQPNAWERGISAGLGAFGALAPNTSWSWRRPRTPAPPDYIGG